MTKTFQVTCFMLIVLASIGCERRVPQKRRVPSVTQGPLSVTQGSLKLTLKKLSISKIFDEARKEELQVSVWCLLQRVDGKPIADPLTNADSVTIPVVHLLKADSQRIGSSRGASTMYHSDAVHPEDTYFFDPKLEFSDSTRLFRGSLLVKKNDLSGLPGLNIHVRTTLMAADKKEEPFLFVFEGVPLPGR